MAWTNQTKSGGAVSGLTLLIDDTYELLIDSTYKLEIQSAIAPITWTNQTKN
jgi:hypothetical protein